MIHERRAPQSGAMSAFSPRSGYRVNLHQLGHDGQSLFGLDVERLCLEKFDAPQLGP